MDVFKDAWEREVRLLTDAVDDITTIDDFLAVSGNILHKLKLKVITKSYELNSTTNLLLQNHIQYDSKNNVVQCVS